MLYKQVIYKPNFVLLQCLLFALYLQAQFQFKVSLVIVASTMSNQEDLAALVKHSKTINLTLCKGHKDTPNMTQIPMYQVSYLGLCW